MKTVTLGLFFLYTWTATACKCKLLEFNEQCKIAKDIFVGKVIDIIPDTQKTYLVTFKIKIIDTWKGNLKDTVSFTQGNSDCDIIGFYLNDTYIIYADNYGIGTCSRTKRYKLSPDIKNLNNKYHKNIFVSDSYLLPDNLTKNELNFLNDKYSPDNPDSLKFLSEKKYLFFDNDVYRQFNKFDFFLYYKNKFKNIVIINLDGLNSLCDYYGILVFSQTTTILTENQKNKLIQTLKIMPCL